MTPRRLRAGLALVATLTLLGASTTVVAAAAPGNDDIATPTSIPGIPFDDSLSTVEATSASLDPDLCVTNGHTVWYEYASPATEILLFDTFGSDFDTVVHVGTPAIGGGIDVIACVDDSGGTLQSAVAFTAEAGVTYLVAVGSFADAAGGNLSVHLDVAPPPIELEASIDQVGAFDRYGVATIHGTVTCSAPAAWAEVNVSLAQRVGRSTIRGYTWLGLEGCGPTPTPWSSEIWSPDGRYAGGRATVYVMVVACDFLGCVEGQFDASVQLKH
ncbi:MAG: hypothetical protein AB1736_09615 [Chloroflexota bacterium]